MGPHSYRLILQTMSVGDMSSCLGFHDIVAVQPTRLLVISDGPWAAARQDLVFDIEKQFRALSSDGVDNCGGPADLACWATREPQVRNLLVVVAGDLGPSNQLVAFVDQWMARGFEAIGVFRMGHNPDVVLPAAIARQHAPSWTSDIRDVAADIVDSVVLGDEERRVFISYSHQDGRSTAQRLYGLLTQHRFDVFLDRFSLPPGVDFIERISDELIDKSMVVVVETAGAVASTWVQQEVATAISKRIGLAAVHLDDYGPTVGQIDERARCRVDDDERILSFLLEQHREQFRQRRDALLDSIWQSLRRAGIAESAISIEASGFRVSGSGWTYLISPHVRPADLHRIRVAHDCANPATALVVHPRPIRPDKRLDLTWLTDNTPVAEIDEGLFDEAADLIAQGAL